MFRACNYGEYMHIQSMLKQQKTSSGLGRKSHSTCWHAPLSQWGKALSHFPAVWPINAKPHPHYKFVYAVFFWKKEFVKVFILFTLCNLTTNILFKLMQCFSLAILCLKHHISHENVSFPINANQKIWPECLRIKGKFMIGFIEASYRVSRGPSSASASKCCTLKWHISYHMAHIIPKCFRSQQKHTRTSQPESDFQ